MNTDTMLEYLSDFCPKCTTGTLKRFGRDEVACEKCGKMWGVVTIPGSKYTPRPGGNRYAESRA